MKKVLSICLMLVLVGVAVAAHDCRECRQLGNKVVRFGTNLANISEADHAVLKCAAEAAKADAATIISVDGHTDNRGVEAANQRLSERRAQAVKNVLVSRFGVNPRQIKVTGHGPSRPVASNETAEGMAQNRRVEIRVAKAAGARQVRCGAPCRAAVAPVAVRAETPREPQIGSHTPEPAQPMIPAAPAREPQIGTHTPEPARPMTPAARTRRPNIGPYTPPGDLRPIGRR